MKVPAHLPGYAALRWWLIPIVVLHNFEEWLTFPSFLETSMALVERVGAGIEVPPWPVLQMALVFVTLASIILIVLGSTGQPSRLKHWVVCWVASIYLANVLIPHVPAAIIVGGYAPGLLTAVFVNLPFCVLLLWQAAREDYLTEPQVKWAVGAGFLSLPIAVAISFLAAAALVSV